MFRKYSLFFVLIFCLSAISVSAQIIVYPTGNYPGDVVNIQAAVDQAQPGETVLLKAGIFNFGQTGSVSITKNSITVRGETVKDAQGNVIEWLTKIQCGHAFQFGRVKFSGVSDPHVEGLWIDIPVAGSVSTVAIFLNKCSRATIKHNKLSASSSYYGSAITLYGVSGAKVIGNDFSGHLNGGYYESGCDNTEIMGNSFDGENHLSGWSEPPISCRNNPNAKISNNIIRNIRSSEGIHMYGNSSGAVITGNKFENFFGRFTYSPAIHLTPGCNNCTVGANTFTNLNVGTGINVYSDSNMIQNNTYQNCVFRLAGIKVSGHNNQITNENFMGSVAGWGEEDPVTGEYKYLDENGEPIGVGCVLMSEGSGNNKVTALKNGAAMYGFDLCNNVLDLPDYENSTLVYYSEVVHPPCIPRPWDAYSIGNPATREEVTYNFGSAGSEDPNSPLGAYSFKRGMYMYRALYHISYWDYRICDWCVDLCGWHLLVNGFRFEYYLRSFVETFDAAGQPATIQVAGIEIPDPDGTPQVLFKTNAVPGYEKCLNKPAGFITAMQQKVAGMDKALISKEIAFEIPGDAQLASSTLSAASLPASYKLLQNNPNPFNPSTTISYIVPDGNQKLVTLKVYDLRGRLVRSLVEGIREAGTYSVYWDGTDESGRGVSSGVYLYRMQAGEFTQTRKMVILK